MSSQHSPGDQTSGEEEDTSYRERRREAHTAAEQKRRDAIKKGYDTLQSLVPTCQQSDASSHKVSKAVVLQKSIDYLQYLSQQKKKQESELATLRKEVVALQIMRANYDQLVKAHQQAPHIQEDIVPDELKFQVFQSLMDTLFQSFNTQVSMNNFAELSGCVFSWIEDYCKPGDLQEMLNNILRKVQNEERDDDYPDPAYQNPVRNMKQGHQ
eukprot:TRINITY_DN13270_c0_g1_i1.p1 TRINITY_DN13270_c0_g1~~TRINITY_DN13270_c0_g1_i1.p1  ORF type:complete len:212 (-),score=46.04 TRINITY_DN13270_c0_g1_i1:175-810(-)